jgi:hypothetical protein
MTTWGESGVSNEVSGLYKADLWKNTRRGCGVLSRFTSFAVENGYHIRFWHDAWCGGQALKVVYLELFEIARLKDTSVSDHLQLFSDSHQWNASFFRAAHE